ncbi:MAG TPA: hypothetical protein VH834_10985 [Solirubrobacteraceae bacterium]
MPRVFATALGLVAVILSVSACSSNGSGHASSAADPPVAQSASARSYQAGAQAQSDSLGNTVIGGPGHTALAFRFRAMWTGSVVAIRCYVIKNVHGRSGYSLGDMGTMRVVLQADSGRRPHVPVGRALASATFRPAERGFFPLVRFSKPARVTAGRLYNVVFSNVARDPVHNYVSINAMYSASRLGHGPGVPQGLAVLESDGGGSARWLPRRSAPHEYYLPILDVVGARPGQHSGMGYMEVWDPKPIGGTAGVRQLLRAPSGGWTIAGAWLRLKRDGSSGDPLVLGLVQNDGAVLASVSVPAAQVPTANAGWVHVRFATPVPVPAGTQLALTASAASAGAYEAFPIRKGSEYGFAPDTYYNGGYAQFNDGSGWVGWDQWGGHDLHDSDLQFALDLEGR